MKQGWEIKKLGEIIEIRNGRNQQAVLSETGKYKVMGSAGNVMGYATDFICEAGTTIIGRKGNISKPIYIDERFWNVDTAFGFYPKNENEIEKRLIYYLCLGIDFESMNKGTTIPSLVKSELQSIQISYPNSLLEQRHIVSILDKAFDAIAKAKANAEQNLKNAKELFESYLQGVFENKGEGWDEKNFEDVCELIGGSQPSKDDFIYKPKEGYIRLIQVRDYRTSKYITYIPKSKAKRFCSEKDIMIGRYGPPIFGIFKGLEGAYNVALMKAEVKTKICNSDYFYWFLKNNKLRIFVEESSKRAAGQDGIRKELLDKYPVPFPKSLKVQQAVVQNLDSMSQETKKLEAIYQNKINDLEELKKSVLQKAFSGKLEAHFNINA